MAQVLNLKNNINFDLSNLFRVKKNKISSLIITLIKFPYKLIKITHNIFSKLFHKICLCPLYLIIM